MWCSRSVAVGIAVLACLGVLAILTLLLSQGIGNCELGTFPCGNSSVCVPQRHMCDGYSHCPNGEDEDARNCVDLYGSLLTFLDSIPKKNTTKNCLLQFYPTHCKCTNNWTINCMGRGLHSVPQNIAPQVNHMILANNSITLSNESFWAFNLKIIHLAENNLTFLPENVFAQQYELEKLLLMHNQLHELPPSALHSLKAVEWLLLNNNQLSELHLATWPTMKNLKWINLSANKLLLKSDIFPSLPSLMILDLNENRIERITQNMFADLNGLMELNLKKNHIKNIHEDSFKNLNALKELDLSHNSLTILPGDNLLPLHNLETLVCRQSQGTIEYLQLSVNDALGNNPIHNIPSQLFGALANLRSLDLRGIDMHNIDIQMFSILAKLDFVYFKTFYYCTYTPGVPHCEPKSDGISSAEHLLDVPVLRLTVWVVAFFTCTANALVLWGRNMSGRDENPALSFIIRNLAVSDLLMGLYLVVIGYQDHTYRSVYSEVAHRWMSSWTCTAIGVLAMTSSEVSILILTFLSVERFLVIAVPFSSHRMISKNGASTALAAIWILGIVLAIFPVLCWHSTTRFYGTNALCFPLYIDEPYLVGWQYSLFVFLGVNTIGLILMSVLYSMMLVSIFRTRHATAFHLKDSQFVVRFFFIVLTDAFCWAPIIILKIASLFRVQMSAGVYAWVMVFVVPVNSAVNPLLYTFTTPKYRTMLNVVQHRLHTSTSSTLPTATNS